MRVLPTETHTTIADPNDYLDVKVKYVDVVMTFVIVALIV